MTKSLSGKSKMNKNLLCNVCKTKILKRKETGIIIRRDISVLNNLM